MNEKRAIDIWRPGKAPIWMWGVLAALLVLCALLRLHLLDLPFERDEGEYAYAGWLILQGVPPFLEAYNMKMPGAYAAYAVLMAAFGRSVEGVHLGLLIANAATTILLLFVFRRRCHPAVALTAASFYAVASLLPSVHGFIANAEHFVLLFFAAGLLVLLWAVDVERPAWLFAAGLLHGLAFMMKQHAAFLILFSGLYLFFSQAQRRPDRFAPCLKSMALFGLGVLLPFALTCIYLWRVGVFDRFWFWTFQYAREYVGVMPLHQGLRELGINFGRLILDTPLLIVLAAFALWRLCKADAPFERKCLLYGWTALSMLAVSPGLFFRPHYFLLAVPPLAIMAAIGMFWAAQRTASLRPGKAICIALFAVAVAYPLAFENRLFFRMTSTQILHRLYKDAPFAEAVWIGNRLRRSGRPGDRVAVVGPEPQIYFYARLRAATGYLYTYPLMEPHPYASRMQQEMIDQITKAGPRYMVVIFHPALWPKPLRPLEAWVKPYLKTHYHPVGYVDGFGPSPTTGRQTIVWGREAAVYQPQDKLWIGIYERKPGA